MTDQHSNHHDNSPSDARHASRERQRQTLVLAFVIILIWLFNASDARSQSAMFELGHSIQWDGLTEIDVSTHRPVSGARPSFVELSAELSNSDADALPDGWHTTLRLRDRNHNAITGRANATFVLLSYSNAFRPDQKVLARWSMQLSFDEDGAARVNLPASSRTQRTLGWKIMPGWTTLPNQELAFSGRRFTERRGSRDRWHSDWIDERPSDRNRSRTFGVVDVVDRIRYPSTGWLSVRVSVPGSGSFDAVAPVRLRAPNVPILVDRWGAAR